MTFESLIDVMMHEIERDRTYGRSHDRTCGKLIGMYKMWNALGDVDKNNKEYYDDKFLDVLDEI